MILRAGFSIRTKLLFVALLLLLIPWMSYIYVRDMKTFLLSGQEDALSLTARAIATVLHDRPELFTEDSRLENQTPSENEIYAVPLPNYININGDLSDWGEQENQAKLYTYQPLAEETESNNVFSVNHGLGYRGSYIYALFKVTDETVLFRQRGFLRVDAADHIRLTLQDPGRAQQRYTLIAREPGRMSIYLMDDSWQYPITGDPNYNLAAELGLHEGGYNVELRIPRFMLSSDTRIGLEVVDVDDPDTLAIEAIIPTTPQSDNDDLSRLLVQSTEITKILQGLDRADTRIWVIDKNKQPRTVVGNIISEGAENQIDRPTSSDKNFAYYWDLTRYYFITTMQTIFSYIIEERALSFDDHERTVEERNDEIIEKALRGTISSDRRPSIDNQGTILMSAHPIFLGDSIPGAVVVEQSTNQILRRQQETLENVIALLW